MKKVITSLLITAALTGAAIAGESETFGGLGISVWTGKSGVKVAGVIPNSPAEGIGLQSGDLILSANGVEFSAVEPDMQVSYLRGKAGTSVSLIVDRNGEKLTLSTKREELSVQNLDAKEISDWYGKAENLTAEEINFLASKKTTEGYELLGVMQYGMPIQNTAENLNANAVQQISIKKAEEVKMQEPKPIQNNAQEVVLNGREKDFSLVNVKGATVKNQKNAQLYKLLK